MTGTLGLVITLSAGNGYVLNIATQAETIAHLTQHAAVALLEEHHQEEEEAQADLTLPPGGMTPGLLFYDQHGRGLGIFSRPDYRGLGFGPRPEPDQPRDLRADINRVLNARAVLVAEHCAQTHAQPPTIPLEQGRWDEQLSDLARRMWDPDEGNRRGFFHNLFVHGGNP